MWKKMNNDAGVWSGGIWYPKELELVKEVKKMGRKKGGKNGVKKEVKSVEPDVACDDLIMAVTNYKKAKKDMICWKGKMMKLIEAE